MPTALVCVPITVEDPLAARRDAARARDAGANLVEYRLDPLLEADANATERAMGLVADSPLPCIATCRPAYEGGDCHAPDDARVGLLESLARADTPPRYIDFEYLPYARSPDLRARIDGATVGAASHTGQAGGQVGGVGLILSTHDFESRPDNLMNLVAHMRATPATILKIAFRARSARDNLELFELLRERDRPTIALGMGEHGLLSRVLAPKFGGFLTFASLRDAAATAPGQPTIAELLELYRFRSITARTRVYAVLGHPVAHSLGPHVHNAGFEAAGHDGVYLPIPVPPEWEHFKATVLALLDATHLDFAGASVTLPHKEHLLRLAREDRSRRWSVDEIAARVGAANTLVVERDGTCVVTNTDVAGVVGPLAARLGSLEGVNVAVVGAGGAARAAAAGLAGAGATVVVYARRDERARALAESIAPESGRVVAGPWDRLGGSCCRAYVHCTPVGLAGGADPSGCVLPDGTFDGCTGETIFFDTVYTPIDTPLVRRARDRGATVITGLEMFVAQGAAQFTRWTGGAAPTGLFTRVSQETLASTGGG